MDGDRKCNIILNTKKNDEQDEGLITCAHYLSHCGPFTIPGNDGIWIVKLKLAPSYAETHRSPLGIDIIRKLQ